MLRQYYGLFVVLGCLGVSCSARAVIKSLPFPDLKHSFEPVELDVTGILHHEGRLYFSIRDHNVVVSSPFNAEGKNRRERFGAFAQAKRYPIAPKSENAIWLGVAPSQRNLLVLDGGGMHVMAQDWATGKEVSRRTIAWDLIRPPRDRGGEATSPEINRFRNRFKKAFRSSKLPRLVGMVAAPKGWLHGKGSHYFVGSQMPGFSVLALRCDELDATQCMVARGCFVENMPNIAATDIVGIAVSAKRKRILLADRRKNRLLVFAYRTCHDVVYQYAIDLPRAAEGNRKHIKTVNSVYVDQEDRLWVGTNARDDYLNAAVYFWEKW